MKTNAKVSLVASVGVLAGACGGLVGTLNAIAVAETRNSAALDPAKIVEECEKKVQEIKSFRGKISMLTVAPFKFAGEGEIIFGRPHKYRIECKLRAMGELSKSSVEVVFTFDGETLWQQVRSGSHSVIDKVDYSKLDSQRQKLAMIKYGMNCKPLDMIRSLTDLGEGHSLQVVGIETLDDRKVYVLRAELKGSPTKEEQETAELFRRPIVTQSRLWVGVEDGFPYKVESYGVGGEVLYSVWLRDLQFNMSQIDPRSFAVEVPPGVSVKDGTDELKRMRLGPVDSGTAEAMQHYWEGGFHYKAGRYDDAIREYKKAIELRPDQAGPHHSLAFAYYKKQMYEEAIKEFEVALRLNPENKVARRYLTRLRSEMKK